MTNTDPIRRTGRATSAADADALTRHTPWPIAARTQGARQAPASRFASSLTDAEWQTRMPKDGRTVGVIVHHVASVYPIEIQLAQTIARASRSQA